MWKSAARVLLYVVQKKILCGSISPMQLIYFITSSSLLKVWCWFQAMPTETFNNNVNIKANISGRCWQLECTTLLCFVLHINHRSSQIKQQDVRQPSVETDSSTFHKRPNYWYIYSSGTAREAWAYLGKKIKTTLYVTSCTCKLSDALFLHNVAFFFFFWKICKCVLFTGYGYQILPLRCRNIWR